MPTLLFVCTANRYRSAIAQAYFKRMLLRKKLDFAWQVKSAGTWTDDDLPPMPRAIEDAKQLGLDIRDHLSTAISETVLQEADLVLVMESGQKEALQIEFPTCRDKIYLLSEVVTGEAADVPDPAQHPSDKTAIPGMITLLENGFEKILARAQK